YAAGVRTFRRAQRSDGPPTSFLTAQVLWLPLSGAEDAASEIDTKLAYVDPAKVWTQAPTYRQTDTLPQPKFALLDVSTNADLMGVADGGYDGREGRYARFKAVPGAPAGAAPPVAIEGMDLVAQNRFVRGLLLPQMSNEPLIDRTPAQPPPSPPPSRWMFFKD